MIQINVRLLNYMFQQQKKGDDDVDVKQLTELFRKIKIIKRRSAVKLSSCKDKKMKNKWHELK